MEIKDIVEQEKHKRTLAKSMETCVMIVTNTRVGWYESIHTLNSFAQNNETGFFDEYYDNHGVFIMKHFAEQFSHQHDLEHREWFGENLRYVIEEFEI